MNLEEIKNAVKTTDREVEFKPAGTPTGWYFTLRHESAPQVQDVMKRFNTKVRELALKRKNSAYQNLVAEHEDSLRIAHVSTWRWQDGVSEEDGRPAFNNRELKAVLDNPQLGYHVKRFIDEEVGSLDDFLEMSGND